MKSSYAQRQEWRRLRKAASRGAGAAVAMLAAVLAASANQAVVAILLGLAAGVLTLASRHALGLARRSRVGAVSEAQVRRALKPLTGEGWQVRHALDWAGRGDLDHVVRSPSGMGFVIETKTLRYSHVQVVRTIEAARWVGRRRRRYPCGVVPVICLVRERSLERQDGKLLIVSLDRLLPAMRVVAANGGRIAPSPPGSRAPWRNHAPRPAGGRMTATVKKAPSTMYETERARRRQVPSQPAKPSSCSEPPKE